MIVLAVLEWLASKMGGVIGENWFYEQVPLDDAGKPKHNGVTAMEVQAPRSQREDNHSYIVFYAMADRSYVDPSSNEHMGEKQAVDDLMSSIEKLVSNSSTDSSSYILESQETKKKYYQVRLYTSTGKHTIPARSDGAAVKSLEIEVYYQEG